MSAFDDGPSGENGDSVTFNPKPDPTDGWATAQPGLESSTPLLPANAFHGPEIEPWISDGVGRWVRNGLQWVDSVQESGKVSIELPPGLAQLGPLTDLTDVLGTAGSAISEPRQLDLATLANSGVSLTKLLTSIYGLFDPSNAPGIAQFNQLLGAHNQGGEIGAHIAGRTREINEAVHWEMSSAERVPDPLAAEGTPGIELFDPSLGAPEGPPPILDTQLHLDDPSSLSPEDSLRLRPQPHAELGQVPNTPVDLSDAVPIPSPSNGQSNGGETRLTAPPTPDNRPGHVQIAADGPHLGAAVGFGGAAGGALALGQDLFRKFVLGEDIDGSQMATDTAVGAVEGAGTDVASELLSHQIIGALGDKSIAGVGSELIGKIAGGGIVDGLVTGIGSTFSNAGAVESGELDAAQATANVLVDAGVGVTGGVAGAATGAAIGTCVAPVVGTTIGAGLGFVGGAASSLGLSLLAEGTGFSGWAKEGIGDALGFAENPLDVAWSGINGGIEGAKTGAMAGGVGGAALGAISTGASGAALGLASGGPLGALVGGAAGAGVGAVGGGLLGAGMGAVPGALIGAGMGIGDGLREWFQGDAEQPGDFVQG